ncbi:hypothetical protein CDIK_2266 [Cucumispora dikerogammari]|nr:hypothetical protein CDIK_2266 [Cucumispora dikerogammari]
MLLYPYIFTAVLVLVIINSGESTNIDNTYIEDIYKISDVIENPDSQSIESETFYNKKPYKKDVIYKLEKTLPKQPIKKECKLKYKENILKKTSCQDQGCKCKKC